ncbi:SPOSA6832_02206, partial [Sporobolomyces salmonicolor]
MSSFSPLLPPAITLAVKPVHLNAWLSTGGDRGSKGYLAGSWAWHWPIHYPGSDKDCRLSWAGIISVNGTAYEFLGAPVLDPSASDVGNTHVARQITFEYTATRSIFFRAGGVSFNATFLSPVTPDDEVCLSLPFSHLSVDIDPDVLKKLDVTVYMDISGEWASGDSSANIVNSRMKELQTVLIGSLLRFETTKYTTALASTSSRGRIRSFSASWESKRNGDQLSMRLRWCVFERFSLPRLHRCVEPQRNGTVASSGSSKLLCTCFVTKGRLSGTQDSRFRAINDDAPVFGFSIPLSVGSPRAVFTIGHVRDPYVNYVTPHGQLVLRGLWTTRFPHFDDAVSTFQRSFPRTLAEARQFDTQVRRDAQRVSGNQTRSLFCLSILISFLVLGIVAELAKQTRRWTDWVHYRAVAELALTGLNSPHPHVKLAYQDKDPWGLLCAVTPPSRPEHNLFGDRILALDLFPRQLYEQQSMWYRSKQEKYGVRLDSRHKWTNDVNLMVLSAWVPTDWQVFAAASATDKQARDMFINSLFKYLKEGKVGATLPDLYETPTANWPGQGGLDWPIHVIAQPVVGAHFALLALEKANGANGVLDNPFRGKDEGNGLRGTKLCWKRDV